MDEPRKKPTPRPDPPPPLTDGLEPWPPAWLLALATFCVILGVVLLIVTLAGCAPPAVNDGPRVLDVSLLDAQVPAWLWSGADHPEWATCRYEPPAALCTEVKP